MEGFGVDCASTQLSNAFSVEYLDRLRERAVRSLSGTILGKDLPYISGVRGP